MRYCNISVSCPKDHSKQIIAIPFEIGQGFEPVYFKPNFCDNSTGNKICLQCNDYVFNYVSQNRCQPGETICPEIPEDT